MGDEFYVLRQGEASVTVHTDKGDKATTSNHLDSTCEIFSRWAGLVLSCPWNWFVWCVVSLCCRGLWGAPFLDASGLAVPW